MGRGNWSVGDAKSKFSKLVELARREPQMITKGGKPAVVVLDAAEYERLRRLDRIQAPNFVQHLLSMPQHDVEFSGEEVRLRDVDF